MRAQPVSCVTARHCAVRQRRVARVAEGAPLLREYRVKSLIEGSNPSLSASLAKSRLHVIEEPLFVDVVSLNNA